LFNGASITEIIRAAHWASESTFTSFYMKDLPTKGARFARSAIKGRKVRRAGDAGKYRYFINRRFT
jgi:hypothetical protein